MKASSRHIVFLLLCWFPLQGLAAMALDCHLLEDSLALEEKLSPATHPATQDVSVKTLSGSELSDSNVAKSDKLAAETPHCGSKADTFSVEQHADTDSVCTHCQGDCHNGQISLISKVPNALPLIPESPAPYILPHPATVFPSGLQRPPRPISRL